MQHSLSSHCECKKRTHLAMGSNYERCSDTLLASELHRADISSIPRLQGRLAQPFRAICGYALGLSSQLDFPSEDEAGSSRQLRAPPAKASGVERPISSDQAWPSGCRVAASCGPARPNGLEVDIYLFSFQVHSVSATLARKLNKSQKQTRRPCGYSRFENINQQLAI